MTTNERERDFTHLFSETVQETMNNAGYGSWRSISDPAAVSLSFGFPFPESFPNDELVASAEAVFEAEGDVALQYTGGEYASGLSGVVADRARDRGIDCEDDEVILTNGSTHAIDVVSQTFLDPGDLVVTEAPTFMGALSLFRNYGVDIEGVEMDADGLDVDALAADLEARESEGRPLPKLLYTIPTFHNPTGVTLAEDRRKRLLELAAEYEFVVLEDDAYGELRYEGADVPSLAALDDTGLVVRVSTFSKTIAPGIRTGWIVADEELAEEMRRINAGGTNTFTQGVVGRYCEAGLLEENVVDLRESYSERCAHMLACLDEYMPAGADWSDPDGGFFVWVELPEGVDAEEMLPEAVEEGVVYLPGHLFYPDDRGHDCLRISFSHVPLDEMERGIEALAAATRTATSVESTADD
ncbi:aminotransferase-like domain-containing protein [Candidatus Halobonum tyrrellensis]|uniref:GntR family transcriptional regulator n=1 Tax=Candidatus Halobonum tyrrellensis G22 TaxID=1324957 RepID=V4HQG4_9EURY|nr:PLP-dependent aminotransferase family protein [Candidatus Halobonum tyrrellensis]ESP90159.1 GntR family transcriptional regulator [Candidatus Halobonum tyrrellensis G22]